MKQKKTIEQLDRELIVMAMALLALAVIWLVPTLLYYFVKQSFSLALADNATFSAEFIKGVFDRLDIAFFISMPVFSLSLALFGSVLIKNHRQRKQMPDNMGTEPGH